MNRIVKLMIVPLFLLLFVVIGSICASAEPSTPDAVINSRFHLKIILFDSEDTFTYIHEDPSSSENPYCLYLPYSCDRDRLVAEFSEAWFLVNNVPLTSGAVTDMFHEDGVYQISTPDGTYPLRVVSSDWLPSVFITTESGNLSHIHADKANRESASISIVSQGALAVKSADIQFIKGRGNSSWQSNEKKSYNFKLTEKHALLGMSKAKKWVLTSNNMDATLMRNAMAYSLAHATAIPYTIDYRWIDLYLNGSYRGTYMLCEKIEVGKQRVNIQDLDVANEACNPNYDEIINASENVGCSKTKKWIAFPTEPDDISGGYLLESDYQEEFETHAGAFITSAGTCLVLHSPEFPTQSEIKYVSGLYNEFEEALFSDSGVNKKGRSFLDYIDVDSFVDGVLLYELTQDQDHGYSSWYIFLSDESERFVMGPVWDFDQAFENPTMQPSYASSLAKRACGLIRRSHKAMPYSFVELLCSHDSFVEKMICRFPDFLKAAEACRFEVIIPQFDLIKKSAYLDQMRWHYTVDQKKDLELPDYLEMRFSEMAQSFQAKALEVSLAKKEIIKNISFLNRLLLLRPWSIVLVAATIVSAFAALVIILIKRRKKSNAKR